MNDKNEVSPATLAGSSSSSIAADWNCEDESRVRRKYAPYFKQSREVRDLPVHTNEVSITGRIDTTVLPLLFLGLTVFQLDRMNLASALTGGFATDIHVTQETINLGNQLMFMGIVLWEIPCNIALQRVRCLAKVFQRRIC